MEPQTLPRHTLEGRQQLRHRMEKLLQIFREWGSRDAVTSYSKFEVLKCDWLYINEVQNLLDEYFLHYKESIDLLPEEPLPQIYCHDNIRRMVRSIRSILANATNCCYFGLARVVLENCCLTPKWQQMSTEGLIEHLDSIRQLTNTYETLQVRLQQEKKPFQFFSQDQEKWDKNLKQTCEQFEIYADEMIKYLIVAAQNVLYRNGEASEEVMQALKEQEGGDLIPNIQQFRKKFFLDRQDANSDQLQEKFFELASFTVSVILCNDFDVVKKKRLKFETYVPPTKLVQTMLMLIRVQAKPFAVTTVIGALKVLNRVIHLDVHPDFQYKSNAHNPYLTELCKYLDDYVALLKRITDFYHGPQFEAFKEIMQKQVDKKRQVTGDIMLALVDDDEDFVEDTKGLPFFAKEQVIEQKGEERRLRTCFLASQRMLRVLIYFTHNMVSFRTRTMQTQFYPQIVGLIVKIITVLPTQDSSYTINLDCQRSSVQLLKEITKSNTFDDTSQLELLIQRLIFEFRILKRELLAGLEDPNSSKENNEIQTQKPWVPFEFDDTEWCTHALHKRIEFVSTSLRFLCYSIIRSAPNLDNQNIVAHSQKILKSGLFKIFEELVFDHNPPQAWAESIDEKQKAKYDRFEKVIDPIFHNCIQLATYVFNDYPQSIEEQAQNGILKSIIASLKRRIPIQYDFLIILGKFLNMLNLNASGTKLLEESQFLINLHELSRNHKAQQEIIMPSYQDRHIDLRGLISNLTMNHKSLCQQLVDANVSNVEFLIDSTYAHLRHFVKHNKELRQMEQNEGIGKEHQRYVWAVTQFNERQAKVEKSMEGITALFFYLVLDDIQNMAHNGGQEHESNVKDALTAKIDNKRLKCDTIYDLMLLAVTSPYVCQISDKFVMFFIDTFTTVAMMKGNKFFKRHLDVFFDKLTFEIAQLKSLLKVENLQNFDVNKIPQIQALPNYCYSQDIEQVEEFLAIINEVRGEINGEQQIWISVGKILIYLEVLVTADQLCIQKSNQFHQIIVDFFTAEKVSRSSSSLKKDVLELEEMLKQLKLNCFTEKLHQKLTTFKKFKQENQTSQVWKDLESIQWEDYTEISDPHNQWEQLLNMYYFNEFGQIKTMSLDGRRFVHQRYKMAQVALEDQSPNATRCKKICRLFCYRIYEIYKKVIDPRQLNHIDPIVKEQCKFNAQITTQTLTSVANRCEMQLQKIRQDPKMAVLEIVSTKVAITHAFVDLNPVLHTPHIKPARMAITCLYIREVINQKVIEPIFRLIMWVVQCWKELENGPQELRLLFYQQMLETALISPMSFISLLLSGQHLKSNNERVFFQAGTNCELEIASMKQEYMEKFVIPVANFFFKENLQMFLEYADTQNREFGRLFEGIYTMIAGNCLFGDHVEIFNRSNIIKKGTNDATTTTTFINNQHLDQIVAMGFDRQKAIEALDRTNNDLELSLNQLINPQIQRNNNASVSAQAEVTAPNELDGGEKMIVDEESAGLSIDKEYKKKKEVTEDCQIKLLTEQFAQNQGKILQIVGESTIPFVFNSLNDLNIGEQSGPDVKGPKGNRMMKKFQIIDAILDLQKTFKGTVNEKLYDQTVSKILTNLRRKVVQENLSIDFSQPKKVGYSPCCFLIYLITNLKIEQRNKFKSISQEQTSNDSLLEHQEEFNKILANLVSKTPQMFKQELFLDIEKVADQKIPQNERHENEQKIRQARKTKQQALVDLSDVDAIIEFNIKLLTNIKHRLECDRIKTLLDQLKNNTSEHQQQEILQDEEQREQTSQKDDKVNVIETSKYVDVRKETKQAADKNKMDEIKEKWTEIETQYLESEQDVDQKSMVIDTTTFDQQTGENSLNCGILITNIDKAAQNFVNLYEILVTLLQAYSGIEESFYHGTDKILLHIFQQVVKCLQLMITLRDLDKNFEPFRDLFQKSKVVCLILRSKFVDSSFRTTSPWLDNSVADINSQFSVLCASLWPTKKDQHRHVRYVIKQQLFFNFLQNIKRDETKQNSTFFGLDEFNQAIKMHADSLQQAQPSAIIINKSQVKESLKRGSNQNNLNQPTDETNQPQQQRNQQSRYESAKKRSKSEEKRSQSINNSGSKQQKDQIANKRSLFNHVIRQLLTKYAQYNECNLEEWISDNLIALKQISLNQFQIFLEEINYLCEIKYVEEPQENKKMAKSKSPQEIKLIPKLCLKQKVLKETLLDPFYNQEDLFKAAKAPQKTIQNSLGKGCFQQTSSAYMKSAQELTGQILDELFDQTRGLKMDLLKIIRNPNQFFDKGSNLPDSQIGNFRQGETQLFLEEQKVEDDSKAAKNQQCKVLLKLDKDRSQTAAKFYFIDFNGIFQVLQELISFGQPIKEAILAHNNGKTIKFLFRNIFPLLYLYINDKKEKQVLLNSSSSCLKNTIKFMNKLLFIQTPGQMQANYLQTTNEIQRIFIQVITKGLLYMPIQKIKEGEIVNENLPKMQDSASLVSQYNSVWLIQHILIAQKMPVISAKDVKFLTRQMNQFNQKQRQNVFRRILIECQDKQANQVARLQQQCQQTLQQAPEQKQIEEESQPMLIDTTKSGPNLGQKQVKTQTQKDVFNCPKVAFMHHIYLVMKALEKSQFLFVDTRVTCMRLCYDLFAKALKFINDEAKLQKPAPPPAGFYDGSGSESSFSYNGSNGSFKISADLNLSRKQRRDIYRILKRDRELNLLPNERNQDAAAGAEGQNQAGNQPRRRSRLPSSVDFSNTRFMNEGLEIGDMIVLGGADEEEEKECSSDENASANSQDRPSNSNSANENESGECEGSRSMQNSASNSSNNSNSNSDENSEEEEEQGEEEMEENGEFDSANEAFSGNDDLFSERGDRDGLGGRGESADDHSMEEGEDGNEADAGSSMLSDSDFLNSEGEETQYEFVINNLQDVQNILGGFQGGPSSANNGHGVQSENHAPIVVGQSGANHPADRPTKNAIDTGTLPFYAAGAAALEEVEEIDTQMQEALKASELEYQATLRNEEQKAQQQSQSQSQPAQHQQQQPVTQNQSNQNGLAADQIDEESVVSLIEDPQLQDASIRNNQNQSEVNGSNAVPNNDSSRSLSGRVSSYDDSSFEDSYTEYSYDPESDNALENGDESILEFNESGAESQNENESGEEVDQENDEDSQGSNEDGGGEHENSNAIVPAQQAAHHAHQQHFAQNVQYMDPSMIGGGHREIPPNQMPRQNLIQYLPYYTAQIFSYELNRDLPQSSTQQAQKKISLTLDLQQKLSKLGNMISSHPNFFQNLVINRTSVVKQDTAQILYANKTQSLIEKGGEDPPTKQSKDNQSKTIGAPRKQDQEIFEDQDGDRAVNLDLNKYDEEMKDEEPKAASAFVQNKSKKQIDKLKRLLPGIDPEFLNVIDDKKGLIEHELQHKGSEESKREVLSDKDKLNNESDDDYSDEDKKEGISQSYESFSESDEDSEAGNCGRHTNNNQRQKWDAKNPFKEMMGYTPKSKFLSRLYDHFQSLIDAYNESNSETKTHFLKIINDCFTELECVDVSFTAFKIQKKMEDSQMLKIRQVRNMMKIKVLALLEEELAKVDKHIGEQRALSTQHNYFSSELIVTQNEKTFANTLEQMSIDQIMNLGVTTLSKQLELQANLVKKSGDENDSLEFVFLLNSHDSQVADPTFMNFAPAVGLQLEKGQSVFERYLDVFTNYLKKMRSDSWIAPIQRQKSKFFTDVLFAIKIALEQAQKAKSYVRNMLDVEFKIYDSPKDSQNMLVQKVLSLLFFETFSSKSIQTSVRSIIGIFYENQEIRDQVTNFLREKVGENVTKIISHLQQDLRVEYVDPNDLSLEQQAVKKKVFNEFKKSLDEVMQLLKVVTGIHKMSLENICRESELYSLLNIADQILAQERLRWDQNNSKNSTGKAVKTFIFRNEVKELVLMLFSLTNYNLAVIFASQKAQEKKQNQKTVANNKGQMCQDVIMDNEEEEQKRNLTDTSAAENLRMVTTNDIGSENVEISDQQKEKEALEKEQNRQIDSLVREHLKIGDNVQKEALNPNSKQFVDLFKNIVSFFIRNKMLVNQILRVNQHIVSIQLKNLVIQIPQLFDFDTKRLIWRTEIKKHTAKTKSHVEDFTIKRQNAFGDSVAVMKNMKKSQWLSTFRIQFENERGVDEGGLTKEWYTILSQQMFQENMALFCKASQGSTYFPNPKSTVQGLYIELFEFIGKFFAKALLEQQLLDCYFVSAFYKMILDMPLVAKDLEDYDETLSKSLNYYLKNDGVEHLCTYFTLSQDYFGKPREIELCENGAQKLVTDENKHEYVRLVANYKLRISIEKQMSAFLKGFHMLLPKNLIKIFDHRELELLISGLQNVDIDDLRENTNLQGYNRRSKPVTLLFEVLQEFDNSQRSEFIQFVTGSSKVPVEGFKGLRGQNGYQRFTIFKVPSTDQQRLPQSHTCMNQLDLPQYKTVEALRRALVIAMQEGKTFEIA